MSGPGARRRAIGEPLDAPDVRLITWKDGALRRLELPPIGASLELPKTPGVFELATKL